MRTSRVGIVLRDPDTATIVREQTTLPVLLAADFPALRGLYAELDAKVALYCNNSPRNFHSLLEPRMLHVHINHGESDKQSMASNNAKSYDRVFVAGQAAVQRYAPACSSSTLDRLVRIGRPQLDLHRVPVLAPSARRTVLYAPTWEGDADYNNYSSVDTIGPGSCGACWPCPTYAWSTSRTPGSRPVTTPRSGRRTAGSSSWWPTPPPATRRPDTSHSPTPTSSP